MAGFTVETRDGETVEVKAREGATLLHLITKAGVELASECGGVAACASCHVYVVPPGDVTLPPIGPSESRMLATAAERTAASRLACQVKFEAAFEGMAVTIAPFDPNAF